MTSQYLHRLMLVLNRLCDANMEISPNKCHFFQRQVDFLGFVISGDGIRTNPIKTEAIVNWPTPTSSKDIKAFCATVNYYRRHIKDLSSIAAPLYALTKQNMPFIGTNEHMRAFDTLKLRLTSAPMLAIYDQNAETIVDTDASGQGLGAVLSQIQDGHERVVAYASRTLNDAEKRYSVTKRELLAVIYALKQFRHYILAAPFVLRTDHAPLVHIQTMRDPGTHIGRWLDYLQEYQITIVHRVGCVHGNADGLSRRSATLPLDTESPVTQTILSENIPDTECSQHISSDMDSTSVKRITTPNPGTN